MRWVVYLALAACQFTPPPSSSASDADDQPTHDAAVIDQPVDQPIDAMVGDLCAANQAACVGAGGQCDNGACTIRQSAQSGVTCPSGMPCTIECAGSMNACQAGLVDCGAATSCTVRCMGNASCQGFGVSCGSAAPCNVECIGQNACQQGGGGRSVRCGPADCTVTCSGTNACSAGIDPGDGQCTSHCCGDHACGNAPCATSDHECSQ